MNGCRRQGMRAAPSIYPKTKAHAESFQRFSALAYVGHLKWRRESGAGMDQVAANSAGNSIGK
jgi:hypothetical protein